MGNHRKPKPILTSSAGPGETEQGHEKLAALVEKDLPTDEDGDVREPTNPDLWGSDPFYDQSKRPRFAVWALALCVVLVLTTVGGVSFMFGKGSSETPSETITATITEQAAGRDMPKPLVTKTVPGPTVTRKSQVMVTQPPKPPETVITTKTIAPRSTLTTYRTKPGIRVTVRATTTRTVISEAPTVYQCFQVRLGAIVREVPCP